MQELISPSVSTQERKVFENFLTLVANESIPRVLSDFTGRIISVSDHPIGRGVVCLAYSGELYGQKVIIHAPVKTAHFSHQPRLKVRSQLKHCYQANTWLDETGVGRF